MITSISGRAQPHHWAWRRATAGWPGAHDRMAGAAHTTAWLARRTRPHHWPGARDRITGPTGATALLAQCATA